MHAPLPRWTRRDWLKASAATLAGGLGTAALGPPVAAEDSHARPQLPPVRQITRGPRFHWFGYYDKLQFDPNCRYVLGMEVDFEHRSPRPDDVIRIGMVDLEDGDRWIELGTSRAWCWQQGCMLQWVPGSASEILWNDRQDERFVCHILDVKTGAKRTIPHAIYALSPDGTWAASLDFRRVNDTRPGYGYAGLADPNAKVSAPADSGLVHVDLKTGASKLLFSLADAARIPFAEGDLSQAKHWFNHLLVNTDGTRVELLHRWVGPGGRGFTTRMLTAAPDGSDVRVIDPSGRTSHFIWRDPRHILAWSWHKSHGSGFYLFEDKEGGTVEIVGNGVMTVNGHCTYLPGNAWILNDTYPQGKERLQNPYLYHVSTNRRYPLGHFHLPKQYAGEWRCDTHPRFSPDGKLVCIDSPHTGQGRQLHLIDVSGIVGA